MMSRDGRCKTFDARADGFVRSEGCGLVVLKRLSDAIADGDPIRAVIRGSAVNHDGRSAGLTAPNGAAQREVIGQALANAGLEAGRVSYVETHGSGTALGDPIEVEALAEVYGCAASETPCVLGAVKSNIGHAEAAAGIAGLIKAVLALEHEAIPANLHFQSLNPNILLEGTRLVIPTQLQAWRAGGRPRCAAVSSFGWSGTNAHVVIEEAPARAAAEVAGAEERVHVLALSARSGAALRDLATAWLGVLNGPAAVGDLCGTAAVRRSHHAHRAAVVGRTREELSAGIGAFLRGEAGGGVSFGRGEGQQRAVFVFSGQGGQWGGMGRQMLARSAAFRGAIAECAAAFRGHVGWDLAEELEQGGTATIDRVQPTLFALGVGLSAHWRSWGIEPGMVVGHSMGEVTAAHVAGHLTLEDAARVICVRSRLLRRLSGRGAMLTVELSVAEAAAAIAGYEAEISVAVSNSARWTVLSGSPGAIAAVAKRLGELNVYCRAVQVDVASHSPQVDEIGAELIELLGGVQGRAGAVPMWSTVDSRVICGDELGATYWARNLRAPVCFARAVEEIGKAGHRLWIEVSPHPVLLGSLQEAVAGGVTVASMRREEDAERTLLEGLAALYAGGGTVLWEGVYGKGVRCVELPKYPWQRETYWLEDAGGSSERGGGAGAGPGLGGRVSPAGEAGAHYWERELSVAGQAELGEHRVQGEAVLAGSRSVEWALQAAREVLGAGAYRVEEIEWKRLLSVGDGARIQVALRGTGFAVYGRRDGEDDWREHARGRVVRLEESGPGADVRGARERCATRQSGEEFYRGLAERGLAYGKSHRGVQEVWRGSAEAVGRVACGGGLSGILDACFQVVSAACVESAGTRVPVRAGSVSVWEEPRGEVWVWARRSGAIEVVDGAGRRVIAAEGLELEQLGGAHSEIESWFYELEWHRQDRTAAPAGAGGRWVVVGDGGGVGERLCAALAGLGAQSVGLDGEAVERVVGAARGGCRGIVVLWGLEGPVRWEQVLRLVQALAQHPFREAPRLWLVTRGLESAPLWGLGRTVAYEHAELNCSMVEFADDCAVDELAAELCAGTAEDQVRLLADGRYVARLVAAPEREPSLSAAAGRAFRLESARIGRLDALGLRAMERRGPGAGEVAVEVAAAGLSFKDVLIALGTHPNRGEAVGLGQEFAGRITAVGSGVEGLRVGDAVVGCCSGSFASEVIVPAAGVTRKPNGLGFEEAGGLPVAMSTAYHSLHELARVRAGERVLIHSAAGATGLAMVGVAHWLGAEVWATAGTPEKRAYLRALGIREVMDSRSCAFAGEIAERTGGRGMDVVVNSLTGEAVAAGLSVLAVNGRFIELATRDIYAGGHLQLAAFRKGSAYFAVDLKRLLDADPHRFQKLLARAIDLVATRAVKPLPVQVLGIADAATAFGKLAAGEPIGKLVLSLRERERALIAALPGVRRDATYLITGGLGGIGLRVARWLVERGARHLALAGRRPPGAAAASAALAALRAAGVEVRVFAVDVADAAQLARMLAEIDIGMPALCGVLHAAGVLEDGMIVRMSADQFARVLAPKVEGAKHLHALTRERALDCFVLFSSVASLLGSPGQSNYAAANAYLDALAAERRRMGLPATSINWGSWAEIGLAAAQDNRGARLAGRGIATLPPDHAVQALEKILQQGRAHTAVMPFDLRQWRQYYPKRATAPLFLLLPQPHARNTPRQSPFREQLAAAVPHERLAALERHILEHAAVVLCKPVERLNKHDTFGALGLDSLIALEFRNRLELSLTLTCPATLIWNYRTVPALAKHLCALLKLDEATLKNESDDDLTPLVQEMISLADEERRALSDATPGRPANA
jgi:acyl transferase domain-containing protein/NAD(P)-dependent dehydrogenase (short-subunit alcohol dehydrogenase family)/acyl carrier protein